MEKDGRRVIVLVDDNIANLTLGKKVLKDHYEVFTVPSAEKLFKLMQVVKPELILLDIEMPDMDGYATLEKLKADNEKFDLPVIFLTSRIDSESEYKGLSIGAVDYVYKPFSPPLLVKRIETHLLLADQRNELRRFNEHLQEMIEIKTEQVLELQNAVMGTLAEMVEFRDNVTGDHVGRTVKYLKVLMDGIKKQNVYQEEFEKISTNFLFPSAQLHDVGKVAISDVILNKPGKLTPEEFEIIKRHTSIGVDVINRIEEQTTEEDFLENAKVFAATHHEKWDGSGYPEGLAGKDIPLLGRMMAIADVYDALIARRPYKDPMPVEQAKAIILEGSGTHFDPKLVEVFYSVSDEFAKIAEQANSDYAAKNTKEQ